LNLEVSLLMADPHVVGELGDLFETYRHNSVPLTLEKWRSRPLYQRFIEGLARLTATVQ